MGLISPPPHHDIYSIEDLKQLIYDLRCANPRARVSVKLVSEVGVGTVAAGVAKANADHVVIAGHDGGTGASPQASIQHAGVPWEIGLAETQQTLLRNDLRSRILVEVDGQMRTGRDVVTGALLGADEFGFSTAPLIALGCVMMRVCHLNTCPVGVATQDPELRARFEGQPEHVVNYLFMVAEEARRIMAGLGVRTMEDLIGRTDLLEPNGSSDHWKTSGIDLTSLLAQPEGLAPAPLAAARAAPEPVLYDSIDVDLLQRCRPAIEEGRPVRLARRVENKNRAVGGLLSGEIARVHGEEGLPAGSVELHLEGSAGQSFGAWLARGVELQLEGDANDYCGKGLSGGTVVVRPPAEATFVAEDNVIVGNTVLYGATSRPRLLSRAGGGALRGAQLRRDHGGRRRGRPRLRVHDRRPRGGAGADGPELRCRHERRHRLRARRRRRVPRPLQHGAGGLRRDQPDEAEELRGWIEEHGERTGSAVAERVLGDWQASLNRIVKVMPHDYKRALISWPPRARRRWPPRRPARRQPRLRRRRTDRRWASSAVSCVSSGWLREARPRGARGRLRQYFALPEDRMLRDQARAAWTVASRSATRAVRWAT